MESIHHISSCVFTTNRGLGEVGYEILDERMLETRFVCTAYTKLYMQKLVLDIRQIIWQISFAISRKASVRTAKPDV